LIYLKRVANEIKNVGLYDLILQDVQKIAGKNDVSEDQIIEILQEYPEVLRDYKQTNVEYNIGNIHLRDIDIKTIDNNCHSKAKEINKNLQTLRDIEKYTLDFEQSPTLVIIFSIEFFVLFSVQYFIVLLDLKDWQILIYTIFALSIVIAWLYAKKERKKYEENSKKFEKIYEQTLKDIKELEEIGCVKKCDLIIQECEEHV